MLKQKDFSKGGTFLEIPNLLSLQLDSFFDFVQQDIEPTKREARGLEGVFRETFPIEDEHKNFRLEYIGYAFGEPKYSPDEAVAKGVNYSMPLKVVFRMIKKGFGKDADKIRDILEQEVYFCDLPWMTQSAAFIINGVERVIVSQLHRSPGVYFSREGAEFSALLVPLRGAWFELVVDKHDTMVVLLDRKRRISAATFMRAIGYTHEELFGLLFKTETAKLALGQVIAKDIVGPDDETYARTGDAVNEGLLEFLAGKGVAEALVVACTPPRNVFVRTRHTSGRRVP